jgi:hypothetical protein
MLVATTPNAISSEIIRFCETIVPGSTPIFMDVQPDPHSVMSECFDNVNTFAQRRGGTPLLGWTIWNYHGLWLDAELHSVWKAPDGKLSDITPPVDGEAILMFLPDPTRAFDYENPWVPGNRRVALVDDIEVAQHIEWAGKFDTIRTSYPRPQTPEIVFDFCDSLALKTEYLKMAFQNHGITFTEPLVGIDTVLELLKLNRPDAIQPDFLCPCGSHKPYGGCCRTDDISYKRNQREKQVARIFMSVATPRPTPDPTKALPSGRCPCGSKKMFKKCHGAG